VVVAQTRSERVSDVQKMYLLSHSFSFYLCGLARTFVIHVPAKDYLYLLFSAYMSTMTCKDIVVPVDITYLG
jgi:hypothetical protein